MKKASRVFCADEKEKIEAAVGRAEGRTSGEIVPVVATASGRYDRGEDLFGVLVALASVTAAWFYFQKVAVTTGEWGTGFSLGLGLLPVLLIFLGGFLLGAVLATVLPELRLPFVSRKEMLAEVEQAAVAAFQRYRVRGTEGGTGILIYVSLFERCVRVVGDDAIAAKVSQDQWQAISDEVVRGMKTGVAVAGLEKAILRSGELLAQHFPIADDDTNELSNELI